MPLARYQIRNEYSLADPELYRAADKDDPEALLEGVAMAGLVGVLRQLGDLAQFAAEVFHDLHEEVMATAARGHGLMVRVQQLEAEVPSLEKAFLSRTHHSSFFSNGGIDWHPNLRSEQNLITREDLPRFVMDSYEDCRGPPRLFLLDKFDMAGAGACLKRYTDPSFFKLESASSKTATAEFHREKRSRRVKKKAARLRNGETPEVVPTHAKLHQLLLEERIESAYSNPAHIVKLKKRQLNRSGVAAKNGKSYMEKFLESPSPDYKMVRETSIVPLPVKSMSEDTSEAGVKILEISTVSSVRRSLVNENTPSSTNEPESELKPSSETEMGTNADLVKGHEQMLANVTNELSYNYKKAPDETELADDGQKKLKACLDGYHSDDATSEVDNYVDALTTMESEMETDNECRPKNSFLNGARLTDSDGKEHQLQAQLSISQSFGDSSISDESGSFKQDRNEECNEFQAQLSDSQSTGTFSTLEENSSFKRETGEEHMELQAQFSDSQSVGNSSASEEISVHKKDTSGFSHSDSVGAMVENIKSEPLLLSSKFCEYDNEDTHSDHLPQIVESEKPDCNKFVMHDDAEFQEVQISDSGRASSDSHLMNSGHLICCSDIGANSSVIQPTETQLVETSDTAELHSTLAYKDTKCLFEPNAVVPDAHSTMVDDVCPVSSENYPPNNLDDGDPCVQSGASLQISNDLELAPVINPTGTQLVERPSDLVEPLSSLPDDDERKCHVESIAAVPVDLSIVKDDACTVSSEKYPLNNLDDGVPCVQSGASLQISNDLELAPVIYPTRTQLVERPSDLIEPLSILADNEERKCHVEPIAAVPVALSIVKDDACPVLSTEEHPLNNLDESNPHVHPDASLQISDDLELAPAVIPTGTRLVEMPSEPVELDSSLAEDEERKCHVESIAATSNAFSVIKDDACPVVSSEEYSLNMDNGEPYVHSEASQHVSDDLNLAPIDECGDRSKIEILQDGFSNENCDEILPEVNSPGGHTISPFMEEVDLYSGTAQPVDGAEVLDSKAESCIFASNFNCQDSSPAMETPPASSLTREQLSYFTHESPNDEPDPAGVEVFNSDQLPNSEEISRMENENEKSGSTCIVDAVEDDGHLKQPCFAGFVGKGNHVNVNNVFTEKVQSEDQAVSANLQETSPGSSDSYQLKMESSKVESTEIFRDMNAETRKNQLESSSDIISSNIISSSVRDPTNLEESPSSFSDPHVNEMEFNEALARESLTEFEAQNMVNHLEVASADVGSSLNRSVSHDLSDSETSNCIQDLPPKIKHHCISANDVSKVPEFSEPGSQELASSSCQNNSLPSPSYNHLVLETPEQFLQSQPGQQDADFPRVEESPASEKFQSKHMHVSDQPSSSDSLSQPADQEINATAHVMDSLKPLPDPFLVASDINLGEMPPMPPLPPMQWRRGKVQHASQKEVMEVSQASLQPIQGIKTNEKGQFGLVTSETETLQYQNSFLPVMAVDGDKIPYSSGFSVGVSGRPVAVPLQFPFMVNEANGQYNYLVLERSQIQNPFLTLPMVSTGRPPHGYILESEGEMVQHSNLHPPMPPVECAVSGHNLVSSQEKLARPPNQPIEETTSEAKELKHSLSNLEGEHEDTSVTTMPPPSMEIVQHNQSLPPLEGEMASSSDVSALTSEFEGEKSNGIPKNKLPRPRNPLIDAVAAHDKSKLRKVSQRARPETAPKTDERDSLLEQIRTKSFNLKPAVATRPSIQGPKTNLKVAAILEKANAIRQAFAGSDDEDDDDADSWSDS